VKNSDVVSILEIQRTTGVAVAPAWRQAGHGLTTIGRTTNENAGSITSNLLRNG
jgi:hypothetical protein